MSGEHTDPMDWSTLATGLVDALAWPATIIAGTIAFRKPLTDLLGRIAKAKVAGAEFDFVKGAEDLSTDIESLTTSINTRTTHPEAPVRSPDTPDPRKSDYKSTRLIAMARDVTDVAPMAAVALGRSALEAALAESLPATVDGRRPGVLQNIKRAGDTLGNRWERVAREAVKLGNAAAHGEAEHITADAAYEYLDSIENICGFAETVLDQKLKDEPSHQVSGP